MACDQGPWTAAIARFIERASVAQDRASMVHLGTWGSSRPLLLLYSRRQFYCGMLANLEDRESKAPRHTPGLFPFILTLPGVLAFDRVTSGFGARLWRGGAEREGRRRCIAGICLGEHQRSHRCRNRKKAVRRLGLTLLFCATGYCSNTLEYELSPAVAGILQSRWRGAWLPRYTGLSHSSTRGEGQVVQVQGGCGRLGPLIGSSLSLPLFQSRSRPGSCCRVQALQRVPALVAAVALS